MCPRGPSGRGESQNGEISRVFRDAPAFYATLRGVNPKTIWNKAMMATPLKDLEAVHKSARSPCGKIIRKEPGKWGMRIHDEVIRCIFTKLLLS